MTAEVPKVANPDEDVEMQKFEDAVDGVAEGEAPAEAEANTVDAEGEENKDGAAEKEAAEVAEEKETEVKDEDEVFADNEDLIEQGSFALNDYDCTFSAFSGSQGSCLFSVRGDGFENLFAAMKANTAIKKGRYYFEWKMLDAPKLIRAGFATAKGSVCLDDSNSFCFDTMGDVLTRGEKTRGANPRWSRTDVLGILLNVPAKTMCLFLNGTRSPTGHIIQLPEDLFDGDELKDGCELFPTVASKGSAIECNFSTKVWKDLPFKVRMVGGAKKSDVVACEKSKITVLSETDKRENIVDVYIPVGFDTRDLIKVWEAENPDGIVLTSETLGDWGLKSGLQKRQIQGQRGERWGVQCLDGPMSVFPMLLRGGRKYLLSVQNYHNLHPGQRSDIFAKLKHSLNVRINGLVSVDDMISVVEGTKPVPNQVREFYELVKMPLQDEGFDNVKYIARDQTLEAMAQDQLRELVDQKFTEWKKDCKLKSKVTDLKKGSFFSNTMAEFNKLKKFQHKNTAAQARQEWEKEQETKKAVKAAAKARKEAEKKEAAEKPAEEKKEGEEDNKEGEEKPEEEKKPEEAEEEEEEEQESEPPAVMEEFSEEDWMLATLRTEIHALLWAFKTDVNDEERLSFPSVHFAYYYQLYTGKQFALMLQYFNCKTLEEMTRLIPEICKHTACMDEFALRREKNSLITEYDLVLPAMPKDTEISQMIGLTEEARQDRTDRLDAGDENAALNFQWKSNMVMSSPQPRNFAQGGAQKSQGGGQAMKRPAQNAAYTDVNAAKRNNRGNYRR